MRRAALLLALLLPAPAPAARAQGDSITIRRFRVEAVVDSAGATHVSETLVLHFYGPWNGINRDLSLQHRTAQGRREKLRVRFDPPTDERGRPLRHEMETIDGWTRRQKIWVPGAHDAERTVVIRYHVANAIRFFQQGSEPGPLDELYWNVTGNTWTMPIERVDAVFRLPAGVTPTRTAAYTGYEGSTARDADVAVDGSRVVVNTRRRLQSGEGITVGVGWAPGVIPRPSAADVARAEMLRLWPLLLPLLAFYHALRAWRRRGRDPRAQGIVVTYEPPDGLSPAEVGTLIDHRPDLCDITATLVDLAVRGYLGVEERTKKHLFGLISNKEYVFHLRAARGEWGGLADHERSLMNALFSYAVTPEVSWQELRAGALAGAGGRGDSDAAVGNGAGGLRPPDEPEEVELSALEDKFYRSLPGIRDGIYDRLVQRGYYRTRPDKVKGFWIGMAFALWVGAVLAGAFAGELALGWVDPVAVGVGLALSGVVVFLFGLAMPARTVAGARTREAALGFREFLSKVESDRYRRMITSPELFERYLPYAMAFQVEKRWARAFDDLYREPPDWYSGGYGGRFRASSFTSDMRAMSSAAGSSMSSSPSSSGSGGGGSSGGGSGGGGGSGF